MSLWLKTPWFTDICYTVFSAFSFSKIFFLISSIAGELSLSNLLWVWMSCLSQNKCLLCCRWLMGATLWILLIYLFVLDSLLSVLGSARTGLIFTSSWHSRVGWPKLAKQNRLFDTMCHHARFRVGTSWPALNPLQPPNWCCGCCCPNCCGCSNSGRHSSCSNPGGRHLGWARKPTRAGISHSYTEKEIQKKSVHPVKDDNEPGPSQEQRKEAEPEIITQSPSLSKLWDTRRDFSHHPGEHIVTWLLWCWDNGASSLELEGSEARQLGSLAREGGNDKAFGKKAQVLSLWRRLLLGVRERYPLSEDVVCYAGKWTNMERDIE